MTSAILSSPRWLVRFGLTDDGLWKCDLYHRHCNGCLEWRAGYTGHRDEVIARGAVAQLVLAHAGRQDVEWVEV